METKNNLIVSILIIIISIVATPVSAKTVRYVKIDGIGDGSSWANAANNIQTMIDKAVSGDEVWVAKGTYYPITEKTPRDSRSRTLILKDGVSLYGGFGGFESSISQRTISDVDQNGIVDLYEFENITLVSGDIDGVQDIWTETIIDTKRTWKWTVSGNDGNVYCVVSALTGFKVNTKLNGFSITNGGTGIKSVQNLEISNCIISNCYGGGIDATPYITIDNNSYSYSSKGIPISNCMIKNCYAGNGGGIRSLSSLNLLNCKISGCSSIDDGGGIYSSNSSDTTIVRNCTITHCSSQTWGGGIFCKSYGNSSGIIPYTFLVNCHISDCNSILGGGIYSTADHFPTDGANSQVFVSNCFIENCNSNKGGGIYMTILNNTLKSYIQNCTVVNCTAINGGGIYSIYGYLVNNIVANCTANEQGSGVYSSTTSSSAAFLSNNSIINNNAFLNGGSQSNTSSPDLISTFINPTSFAGVADNATKFNDLRNSNWNLLPNSICINSGTSTGIPANKFADADINGNQRVLYGSIDLGAYEFTVPKISIPIFESFDLGASFLNSNFLYKSSTLNTSNEFKWTIINNKAIFDWHTNLTNSYSHSIFSNQIDATNLAKVYLRYDMYYQAYAGTISPLGTEKLNVEYSTDLLSWKPITTYTNANGTIVNKTYKFDISLIIAGKTFFIRFNANGVNSNRIEKWEIDNIIIDADGLSAVNAVSLDKAKYSLNNGILAISNIGKDATIQLFDANGKMLDHKVESQKGNFILPAHGVYIVKVASESGIENKKIVW